MLETGHEPGGAWVLSIPASTLFARRAISMAWEACLARQSPRAALAASPAAACALTCAFPLFQQPKKQPPDADDLTSDSVQSISVNTLFLLSTTVDRMNNVSVRSSLPLGCSALAPGPPCMHRALGVLRCSRCSSHNPCDVQDGPSARRDGSSPLPTLVGAIAAIPIPLGAGQRFGLGSCPPKDPRVSSPQASLRLEQGRGAVSPQFKKVVNLLE